jgi:hypothetical protein
MNKCKVSLTYLHSVLDFSGCISPMFENFKSRFNAVWSIQSSEHVITNFSQLCNLNSMIRTKVDTLCLRPSWESDGIYNTEVHSISRGAHWLPVLLISEAGEKLTCSLVFFIELEGRAEKKELVLAKLKKRQLDHTSVTFTRVSY